YNKALHIKKHVYQRHGVNLNPRKDLKPLLAVAKKSHRYGWLKEYDSIALQQAVINLDVAFSNFFNPKLKARFPTFKSKHGKQSSYHCVGIKVIDGAIKIPKIAPIEARLHREITGTLKAANMMKNQHLARAIGDAGWSGFITKLEYKAAEKGVHLVKLEQWFASSKTCHCCGHKMPEMPLNKRIWQCPECGIEHDRDINAAINIERKGILELQAAGLVVSAHGGQRKSVTQTVAV
uniref:RNA-guided endonuclease InsQ/TnpB family protein n=1 Tax=Proteus faecis TaxID=2050967 RepID=UPI003075B7B8